MPTIVPATTEHAISVARAMRKADIEEVRAASGLSPLAACLISLRESTLAWAALDTDGTAFAVFGAGPYLADVGSPWLLATDRMAAYRKTFLRLTRHFVEEMHREYPILLNYVDSRHTESIRWLLWAGFCLDKCVPNFGHERRGFFRFTKVSLCVSPPPR